MLGIVPAIPTSEEENCFLSGITTERIRPGNQRVKDKEKK